MGLDLVSRLGSRRRRRRRHRTPMEFTLLRSSLARQLTTTLVKGAVTRGVYKKGGGQVL